MFADARNFNSADRPLDADICIIGGGPAGLALFSELDGSGKTVCLLESGGLDPSDDAQRLADGESALGDGGEYDFPAMRVRALGGSSHLWSGITVEPDSLDSRWPLTIKQLDPFLRRAAKLFRLPPSEERSPERLELPPWPNRDLEVRPLPITSRLRLGAAMVNEVRWSSNVHVLLETTAVELLTNAAGDAVECVAARTLGGHSLTVRARQFVVAGGGIESARLLLASRSRTPNGIGNEAGLVGRYFMERKHIAVGELAGESEHASRSALFAETATNNCRIPVALALPAKTQRRENLLGCWMRAYRVHPVEASPAVAAHQRLWAGLQTRERPLRVVERLRDYARDPLAIARYYRWRAAQRLRPGSAAPGRALLAVTAEQEPQADNRITLSERTDRWGTPLARLELTHSETYERSLRRSVDLFDRAFQAAGIGRIAPIADELRLPPALRTKFGAHHMGGTRMSTDPHKGVVDAECRVHGVRNLWIASSSVFPAAGSANPTLTIVALAIRLADRLKR